MIDNRISVKYAMPTNLVSFNCMDQSQEGQHRDPKFLICNQISTKKIIVHVHLDVRLVCVRERERLKSTYETGVHNEISVSSFGHLTTSCIHNKKEIMDFFGWQRQCKQGITCREGFSAYKQLLQKCSTFENSGDTDSLGYRLLMEDRSLSSSTKQYGAI